MPDKNKDRGTRTLKFVRPDDSINAYSNSVRINVTTWDFRFLFGEVGDFPIEGEVPVFERIRITMSPQHAKAFLKVFQNNVEKFEAQYGEIHFQDDREEKTGAAQPTSAR